MRVFDVYQRLAPREYVPVPVKYVDLDDESLERIGQWPWPRTFVAQLVAQLANAGAAAIVFDIVFAEPDRTSPKYIVDLWPLTPEVEALKENMSDLPDHDMVLADVIAQTPVITGFVLTGDPSLPRVPAQTASFAYGGDNPLEYLFGFRGAVANLEILTENASGNGSFNLVAERDGIVRRVPMFMRLEGQPNPYPSLTAEVIRVIQGARTYIIKTTGASGELGYGGVKLGLNNIKIGNYELPTGPNGRMWLHFTGHVPERRIPAWKVLSPEFDAETVEGQIVFIGTSAAGLFDIRATPLEAAAPGVEIHVQAVEQILLDHYLERPDWADGAEIIYMVLLGLLLLLVLPRAGALLGAIAGALGVAVAVAASWYFYKELLWLLDPIYASSVVVVVYMSSTLLNFLRTEAEKRQVRGAFSQYLSPALVEQLADEPERLVLGGEMRSMTLLFCDIRGFTTISEQFKTNPTGLTKLINRFLTPMTDMILDRRGTIDKYMGDCIMAFWNAPLDDKDHAAHGLDSALAMFNALDGLNESLKQEAESENRTHYPINVGIGLNTGECCVGNMGSDKRFDYSVLGDAVNLAARLEGQSKNYGVGVVIGEETRKAAPEFASLELDLIAV
ncbi:MAG: adenylate/guanylate cyclase domain-containing protein, partial [Alphaproteobacteria bacterium]|nr:adenylate/guanylate cyclase domain-containing protein [Alphaproteobacteria bacterium]